MSLHTTFPVMHYTGCRGYINADAIYTADVNYSGRINSHVKVIMTDRRFQKVQVSVDFGKCFIFDGNVFTTVTDLFLFSNQNRYRRAANILRMNFSTV